MARGETLGKECLDGRRVVRVYEPCISPSQVFGSGIATPQSFLRWSVASTDITVLWWPIAGEHSGTGEAGEVGLFGAMLRRGRPLS